MVEQAIQMATQTCVVYHKMQLVFQMFEDGSLKGQKKREMNGITLQKALEGKLAPKLSQSKVFQGLKVHVHVYCMCNTSIYNKHAPAMLHDSISF